MATIREGDSDDAGPGVGVLMEKIVRIKMWVDSTNPNVDPAYGIHGVISGEEWLSTRAREMLIREAVLYRIAPEIEEILRDCWLEPVEGEDE